MTLADSVERRVPMPPHLLAPYVVAAATEVLDHGSLSETSARIIDEAIIQLEQEMLVLNGARAAAPRGETATLARPSQASLRLAALVLSNDGSEPRAFGSPRDEMLGGSGRLQRVLDCLKALLRGDRAAAGETVALFDRVIEQLFGQPNPIDI